MPSLEITPTQNLASAESSAIQALAKYLDTEDGRASGDEEIKLWMFERGWSPSLWRKWSERIATQLALSDPTYGDPRVVLAKLDQRFERLAFLAEERNDLKHAIQATEAQAKLNKAGGYSPPQLQQAISINFSNSTAHLASDEDLARIAGAHHAQGVVVHATQSPPSELDDILA